MKQGQNRQRYLELLDLYLEKRASAEQIAELEEIVLQNETLKKELTCFLSERAGLIWMANSLQGESFENFSSGTSQHPTLPNDGILSEFSCSEEIVPASNKWNWTRRSVTLVSSTALLLLAFLFGWMFWPDPNVATLTSTQGCQWLETSHSTLIGQRIGKGRMSLAKGIATLQFDQGVKVTLEGPVDFEIVDWNTCRLSNGRMVSEVGPGAEGFVVQTPTAVLTDRGTVFGVQVGQSGVSDLQVFQGRVDVSQQGHTEDTIITTGRSVRISGKGIAELVGEGGFEKTTKVNKSTDAFRMIQVTTGVGQGEDTFCQPEHDSVPSFTAPENVLLMKNGGIDQRWSRKPLLRFDLSGCNVFEVESASLVLATVPTGMGYKTLLPDSVVSVYGLTDEKEDKWDKVSLTWLDFPATGDGKLNCDFGKLVKVGEFTIPQSHPIGSFTVKGKGLVDFLKTNTNGVVSFILVCETEGKRSSSYVHGFASHRLDGFQAPTLRLGMHRE